MEKPDNRDCNIPEAGAANANPRSGDVVGRFLASMVIDYEKWHDGIGYDISLLNQMSAAELSPVESVLINHRPRDWRDIEALALINSPRARSEVEAALKSDDPRVRRQAMAHAGEKADPKDREERLVRSLERNGLYGGSSAALDEAAEFHPPRVIDALLRGALHRDGETAVHFAALLFYLHGIDQSNDSDQSGRPSAR